MFNKFLFFIIILCSCNKSSIKMLHKSNFIDKIKNKNTNLYTLKNDNGVICEITNYGARVVSLWVPDKDGNFDDIVLGLSSLKDYLKSEERYLGATVGRYANRINSGKFSIDGEVYELVKNNGNNHLHGGKKGLHDVVWDVINHSKNKIQLEYFSKDMEEGYPGNLTIKLIYELTEKNELRISYSARTDKKTHVNLTHHSFFNLKGAGIGSIEDHYVYINSEEFLPVDLGLIPTGEKRKVDKTPFDFRKEKQIINNIDEAYDQISIAGGYDHNFVLDNEMSINILSARVYEKKSGRVLEVYTNEPGIQFYSGNFLNGKTIGKGDIPYKFRSAFCLETQHYPDTPNNSDFPSTLLIPENEYISECIYKFYTR